MAKRRTRKAGQKKCGRQGCESAAMQGFRYCAACHDIVSNEMSKDGYLQKVTDKSKCHRGESKNEFGIDGSSANSRGY